MMVTCATCKPDNSSEMTSVLPFPATKCALLSILSVQVKRCTPNVSYTHVFSHQMTPQKNFSSNCDAVAICPSVYTFQKTSYKLNEHLNFIFFVDYSVSPSTSSAEKSLENERKAMDVPVLTQGPWGTWKRRGGSWPGGCQYGRSHSTAPSPPHLQGLCSCCCHQHNKPILYRKRDKH